MKSGSVDVLALIGSSRAADILKGEHPWPRRLRNILSLDAKNPALVMADADLEVAVLEVLTGALSFQRPALQRSQAGWCLYSQRCATRPPGTACWAHTR